MKQENGMGGQGVTYTRSLRLTPLSSHLPRAAVTTQAHVLLLDLESQLTYFFDTGLVQVGLCPAGLPMQMVAC